MSIIYPASDLKIHLEADNGTGIEDLSGNEYDATLLGGMGVIDDDFNGGIKAFLFDGIDDHIALVASNLLATGNDFALSAWIKYSHTTNGSRILTLKKSNTPSIDDLVYLYIDGSGHICSSHRNAADSGNIILSNAAAKNDNAWHHVLFRATSSVSELWVDGFLRDAGLGITTTRGNQLASIGSSRNNDGSGTNFWEGRIDDVRVFNSYLTFDGEFDDVLALAWRRKARNPWEKVISIDSQAVALVPDYAPPSLHSSGQLASGQQGDTVDEHHDSASAILFYLPDGTDSFFETSVPWISRLVLHGRIRTDSIFSPSIHKVGVLDSASQVLPTTETGVQTAAIRSTDLRLIGSSGSVDYIVGTSNQSIYIDLSSQVSLAFAAGHLDVGSAIVFLIQQNEVIDPDESTSFIGVGTSGTTPEEENAPYFVFKWMQAVPAGTLTATVINSQSRSQSSDIAILKIAIVVDSQSGSQNSIILMPLVAYVIDSQSSSLNEVPTAILTLIIATVIDSQSASQSESPLAFYVQPPIVITTNRSLFPMGLFA